MQDIGRRTYFTLLSLTILCSRDRCFRKLKYRITAHPVTNFVPSRDRFSPSAAFSNRTLNSMFLLKQYTPYIKKRYSITKIKYHKRNNFLNKYLDTKEYIIWNFDLGKITIFLFTDINIYRRGNYFLYIFSLSIIVTISTK